MKVKLLPKPTTVPAVKLELTLEDLKDLYAAVFTAVSVLPHQFVAANSIHVDLTSVRHNRLGYLQTQLIDALEKVKK